MNCFVLHVLYVHPAAGLDFCFPVSRHALGITCFTSRRDALPSCKSPFTEPYRLSLASLTVLFHLFLGDLPSARACFESSTHQESGNLAAHQVSLDSCSVFHSAAAHTQCIVFRPSGLNGMKNNPLLKHCACLCTVYLW